ncbi:tetratricopeptide repeat protein [Aeromonas caviae]|uniref:tetratricopeptide repeat protein n=1 Tax=Aeromonas TaxID=642 RepID=UPI00244B8C3A|nr:tetratricopeptide repeat protein [Aeromonas caviae]MDX7739363.1 tetratricopeptide repeat protein [Aeromonas caviae]MDX7768973.1 tetratricopeptide repeat protein [Aeromonas caviae]
MAKAVTWYLKVAEQGGAEMKKMMLPPLLAVLLVSVFFPEPAKAEVTFGDAMQAEQGDAQAQFKLGLMHYNGEGWPQDFKQAFAWFRKAAEQGHATAQHNLGVFYAKGQGVPQDYQQAYALFSVAAANGYADAVTNRDILATRLTPAQLVEAQALATQYFERSWPK